MANSGQNCEILKRQLICSQDTRDNSILQSCYQEVAAKKMTAEESGNVRSIQKKILQRIEDLETEKINSQLNYEEYFSMCLGLKFRVSTLSLNLENCISWLSKLHFINFTFSSCSLLHDGAYSSSLTWHCWSSNSQNRLVRWSVRWSVTKFDHIFNGRSSSSSSSRRTCIIPTSSYQGMQI